MDLGAFSDGTPIYIHPGNLRSCDIVPWLPLSQEYSIIRYMKKKMFSWPERVIGYLLLGYLIYVLFHMIVGTFT